jgi:BirA family biotin operon repressor/biotin-[acetyl-CoA-carboxylase] ligase
VTQLKWPNDLLAEDPDGTRKLAGVLTEMATQGMRVEHVIVGIGLNVGTEAFPPELASIATSLRRVLGRAVDRGDVLEAVLEALERRYRAFVADPLATVVAFRARAGFLGQRVSVRSGDERTSGIAEQIDDEGALLVRCDDGIVQRYWAGDVRPETLPSRCESS